MKSIFITFVLLLVPGFMIAQNKIAMSKMHQVENSLIPFVPVEGFKTWNIEDRMKYYGVNGVSIAVIHDYKIDWAKGYGYADTVARKKVDTNTMFSAGSISKLVMAAAAMKLVQDRKIGLNEPINNYLKSWKIKDNEWSATKPVSLKMLLSHTAGTSGSSYFGFTPDQKPLPNIVQILNGDPIAQSRGVAVNSEPAKEFRYSGGGSLIAQLALMDASQLDFETLMQQSLLKPLGLKNSTFAQPLPSRFEKQASWAYSNASWFKGMPYVYPQQAAAGLYTTPSDLALFFIEIQNAYRGKGKVLQQASAKAMLTKVAAVSDGSYKESIGVGPFLIERTDNTEISGQYFEFTGVNAGFLAYGIASVEGGNGVVIMLNSGDDVNGLGKEIRRAVAKTYNWMRFLPEPVEPISLPKSELNEYAGRYKMGDDEVLNLRVENNYLVENINQGGDIYCFLTAKDSLVFTDFNVKGFFKRDENNNVISLQNQYQQKPMPKMKEDEFTPGELLREKKYSLAQKAYAQMNLNDSQITYMIYNLMHQKKPDWKAVETLLGLAQEQHPKSAIVYNRWGDYYLLRKDKAAALMSYKKALVLDPEDLETKKTIEKLSQ